MAIRRRLSNAGDPEARREAIASALRQAGYADSACDDMGALAASGSQDDQVVAATSVLLAAAKVSGDPQQESILVSSSLSMASRFGGDVRDHGATAAFYTRQGDTIEINVDGLPLYLAGLGKTRERYIPGIREPVSMPDYSTDHPSHAIYHEIGHALHFRRIRQAAGLGRGLLGDDDFLKLQDAISEYVESAADFAAETPWLNEEVMELSWAAVFDPLETMAEYYAKVRLTGERSEHLDEFARNIGFPMKELARAARLGKKVKS